MKKVIACLMALLCLSSVFAAKKSKKAADGKIKIGIINNPPSESGYRAANVKDFETVFTSDKYDVKTFYSLKNAQKNGIKVFLFDRMINVKDKYYEAAVVSDMPKEGDTAVAWLKSLKLPEYKVVHIQGAMGSDAQIGRTKALDAEFKSGKMKKVVQQTATWDEAEAKKIVEAVINSKEDFNVIYAENDGMAKGAVAALDEAGITHGVDGKVVVMGFDCNKWALRELLAKNWNYDGQCSPFQAAVIENMIKTGKVPSKKIISDEKGFDARTITQADIDKYGLGD